MKKIDRAMLYARRVGKSPLQVEKERVARFNNYLKHEHELLKENYVLTENDYISDIYPNLCKFSFFPERGETTWEGEKVENVIFILSSLDYKVSSEAKDKLLGKCDVDTIQEIVQTMRRNYERLRCADLAKHDEVHFVKNRKACSICNEICSPIPVKDILAKFRKATINFPHEIPWDEVVNYCEGPHLVTRARNPFQEIYSNLV